ncbi:MAG: hypothetical protein ACI8S6_004927, partial [Myxococcota bacterium]
MSVKPSPLQRSLLAIKRLKKQLEDSEGRQREPIAIVGIGCRFPGGASSPSAYWSLLEQGVDATSDVPSSRWDTQ